MDETNKKYWDKLREFNLSRTPIWISFLFQVFLTIGPFIVIWILVGPDFKANSFNHYLNFWAPEGGYLALVCACYLVYAVLCNIISWLFQWQKADSFTFTFGLVFVFISIILNGIWMSNWNVDTIIALLVRFIIGLAAGLLGVLIGVIVTTFARNSDYKMEERNYELLLAYRDGQAIQRKQKGQLKRALSQEKKNLKKNAKKAQSDSQLKEKLVRQYDEYSSQQKAKKEQKKTKLDAKETKKFNHQKPKNSTTRNQKKKPPATKKRVK